MFARVLRSRASRLTVAAGACAAAATASSSSRARCERVYASGEALGRGVRLELWKAKHENVVVLDLESELLQLGMTRIRDYENEGARFRHDANNVMRAALDLALTQLPTDEEAIVTTPTGHKVQGLAFEDDVQVCGISVAAQPQVQSGLQQVLEATLPFASKLGAVLVDESGSKVVKASLPEGMEGHEVLLLCPELARLDHVRKIMHLLQQEGVEEEQITLVTLVTCPEAADAFCEAFGDARLVAASFDSTRGRDGAVVPGVGAFEGRYVGAPSAVATAATGDESEAAGSGSGSGSGSEPAPSLAGRLASLFSRG